MNEHKVRRPSCNMRFIEASIYFSKFSVNLKCGLQFQLNTKVILDFNQKSINQFRLSSKLRAVIVTNYQITAAINILMILAHVRYFHNLELISPPNDRNCRHSINATKLVVIQALYEHGKLDLCEGQPPIKIMTKMLSF